MIIGIWVIMIICATIILGEIKYRCIDKREIIRAKKRVSKDWKDNIDTDIDRLFIEQLDEEFVSLQVLAMRGSWRLAQNEVMDRERFSELSTEEYTKRL